MSKAVDYELWGDKANLLFFPSGIFALSNGDAVEVVTIEPMIALLQDEYRYIDAFPHGGGARVVALKLHGQQDGPDGPVNIWTSDF